MLRFSIRDLLLVVSLAAALIGWWCEHFAQAELKIERDQLLAHRSIVERAIDRAGYAVVCGFDRHYLVRKDAGDENHNSN